MAKETGTQAGGGATAATVDAKMIEAAKGAMSVAELPEAVFEVADPVGVDQSTPLDAAAVAEAAKAQEEADAAADAETEPEQEVTDDEPAFDSVAFAADYGVRDADLFKDCADRHAALEVLGRRAGYWSDRYGKQTAEVGANRQRIAELEAQLSAKPQVQSAGAAEIEVAAEEDMTPEEIETYLQLLDTNPLAAHRMIAKRTAAGAPTGTGLTEDQVEELLRRRDAERDAGLEATAMDAAHPGWVAERKELMDELAREIGWYPTFEESYELAGLRHQDPAACAAMVAKMQCGASYADARILVIEHPATASSAADADGAAPGPSAHAASARRAAASQAAGPGKNSSATAMPATGTTATSLSELPREVAGAEF